MSIDNMLKPLYEMEELNELLSSLEANLNVIEVYGISDTQKAITAALVCRHFKKPCLFITHNDLLAKKVYEDISFFDADMAALMPSRELIFRRIDARSNEVMQNRLKTYDDIINGKNSIICASIEALLPKAVSPELFVSMAKELSVGDTVSIEEMKEYFIKAGYERIDMVEGKGQFSIRGGIIDFYSPIHQNAVRVELFDDEIDSIRYFDVLTQRSVSKAKEIRITPAREFIVSKEDFYTAAENLQAELSGRLRTSGGDRKKKASDIKVKERISEDIEKLKQGIHFEGIEKYSPYFSGKDFSLIDYLKDCIIFIDEPTRVKQRCETIGLEFQEHFNQLLEDGEVLPGQFDSLFTYENILLRMQDSRRVCLDALYKSSSDFNPQRTISITSRSMHPFHGKLNMLMEEIDVWKKRKYKVLILAGARERGLRLASDLRDRDVDAVYKDELDIELKEGHIIILPGILNSGFDFPSIKYAVISDREAFGIKRKTADKKKGKAIDVFTDLKVGDFVVHENHGIGQYIGIEKLKIDNMVRDYLHIRYSGNDKLYIPTDQLDMIQKYIGAEDKGPKLNKLGGAEWVKVKAKAKKAIEVMAVDLLKLYAERQQAVGFTFSEDTRWQKEFEDMFPYQETQDQLRCIEEIKQSMEDPRVMDRLLCGDVGYGKTEVALRAAFKCVMDGKQVAILVPTTILAQQHYNTCVQRFSNFPVNIDVLSRFKTHAEQSKVVANLKNGNVDILIGTHRLLQNDLLFNDLGLLIIDEEQRFGVAHKEKIKSLKKNVDVLTLTATPIPRTLHMSLIGIRDISIIEEPPEERYPVQTYVMEHNDEIIRDAISKEIGRGGQVYYLHNRVRSIQKVAAKIKEMIPEARVAVAHGQMDEKTLEDTMLDFYNAEYDVLVCTTIIEAGLDIPNVNTIIISDADKMGLSQLYQLRGRVGRSNRLAYAYFTYQRDKVLNEVAEKRLQAIREFTEFGSGFKIAMRDLEIRGTGNLLGREQHGHMEAIGYDLYIKLLEDAVRELKGEAVTESIDTSIELQVSAFIPESYITDENQKIEIYKKIAYIGSHEDLFDIEEEIEDRFGDLPEVVRNLLGISYIKHLARKCGIVSIAQKKNNIIVKFNTDKSIKPETAIKVAGEYINRLLFTASGQPYFTIRIDEDKPDENIKFLKEFLEKISSFQNESYKV
ncbi:MAG TPA: transcription-repair coupling factor [Clostridia bacterium]|nr:transcription-repair coupling factor [Clostridia bacterium]